MNLLTLAGLIVGLPLAGFFIQGLLGRRLPRMGDWFATSIMGVVVALAATVFFRVFGMKGPYAGVHDYFVWFELAPGRAIHAGFLIDNLAAAMVLMVSIVSFVVHLYSIGYMHGDRDYVRFFTVLQIFSAAMLGLVLADNLLTLYVCWELMGLSSYLLIGHFFYKKSAAEASMKAFMVTRIGDVLMFVGIMIIFWHVGSLRFADVFTAVREGTLAGNWQLWAGLLLFGGAVGKSAQFPLHVWLPDAMEGPTPVSALIHAATMVAAGVYLVARMYLLFTPETFLIIAYVGGFTALFSATIGVVMDDIKKVLAYSTISQLGYMMLGLGVGGFVLTGYTGGVYHLLTHAFFKACLFLGSGSVIHAVHTQSLAKMGGLRKKTPWTFWTFLIATLSLTGFPYLFSGFWTKDTIIAASLEFALERPAHWLLPAFAVGAACFTSFYMFRLIILAFFGTPRDEHAYEHAHESGPTMLIPLVILAFLSFGWISFGQDNWFWFRNPTPSIGEIEQRFGAGKVVMAWAPAAAVHAAPGVGAGHELLTLREAGAAARHDGHGVAGHGGGAAGEPAAGGHSVSHTAHTAHLLAIGLSAAAFFIGLGLAWLTYTRRVIKAEEVARRLNWLYTLLLNKYYMDEMYHAFVIRPFMGFCWLMGAFDKWIIDGIVNLTGYATRFLAWLTGLADNRIVDGVVNLVADTSMEMGRTLGKLQTGRVGSYLLGLIVGVVVLAGMVFWMAGQGLLQGLLGR